MIINFVGSPCSGKTTTAASLFAQLKEGGHPAEFLTEQARLYIAAKRYGLGLKPEDKLTLKDYDQQSIMASQLVYETIMQEVCGPDMTVVTDSSFLNSLLYISEEGLNRYLKESIETMVSEASKYPRLIFVCQSVKPPPGTDPNRIHSEEESKAIEAKIPEILQAYAPNNEIYVLHGPARSRHNAVVTEVLKKLAGC